MLHALPQAHISFLCYFLDYSVHTIRLKLQRKISRRKLYENEHTLTKFSRILRIQ